MIDAEGEHDTYIWKMHDLGISKELQFKIYSDAGRAILIKKISIDYEVL